LWHNTNVQLKCLKYRIYPTKPQQRRLEQTLETCRQVYNSLVNWRKHDYEVLGKSPSWYDQKKGITSWKSSHPELSDVHSQVLQDVSVRVDLAFKAFFRRVKAGETPGFPRIKGDGYNSFCFPGTGYAVANGGLRLSKITEPNSTIKMKLHRPIVGTVKTCCIHHVGKKWFVCFSVEQQDDFLPTSEEAVGLDAGLNSFMALSNGEFVDNPRFFCKDEKALAEAGRKQAKTKKRSKERRKANKVLSRIHERIRNRRHNFVHQTARKIVNRYGVIAVEILNVKGMVKNHCLAKSISDASWSMFRTVLTQKAESAAREVIAVNPAYTSQDCSMCGYRPDGLEGRTKKKLSDRWHHCPMCSASLDRDTNAAINILNLAFNKNHNGITLCQVTPVEAPQFIDGE
jgi:putative transposase